MSRLSLGSVLPTGLRVRFARYADIKRYKICSKKVFGIFEQFCNLYIRSRKIRVY